MSRRASNNVSLFPFLAVLVCAMGALILLLLVTTRRIRSNQLAAIEATAVVEEPDETPEPLPVLPPLAMPEVVEEPDFVPTVVPTEGPRVVSLIPPSVSDETLVPDHRTRDREALRGYDAILTGRLRQLADNDRKLYDAYLRSKDNREQLVTSDKQLSDKSAAISSALTASKEDKQRLDNQLAALKRALEKKLSEPTTAVSKFRIVPFDGLSGTVRRPIMIECVQDRFRFIPENVALTRSELEDFITTFNPLLSGASALSTHWAMKKGSTNGGGDPYVLLVVRPSGALGFYAAKRMLRRLDVPIGYELLGEEQELDLPVADQEAVRICRLAVNRTLARRDEMQKLRPLTRSLAKNLPNTVPRQTGRARLQPTGQQTEDDRVRSFQKLLAGMRTQNATRPPGMREFPDFSKPPSSAPPTNNRMQTSVMQNGGPRPANQNQSQFGSPTQRPGQPGTAQLRGQTVSRQSTTPNQAQNGAYANNNAQPNSGVSTQPPGAARLTPSGRPDPHPAPRFNQGQARNTLPPAATGGRVNNRANPQNGQITSVTDGSTKPTASRQNPANSFPGFQSGPTAGGQSRSQANSQPPSGTQAQPIQYRRAVELLVDSNSVTVGGNRRIAVNGGQVTGPWLGAILTQIEAEVRKWGQAPTGTAWAPEVRFRIRPGANQTHSRVKSSLSRLGMKTTDEFTANQRTGGQR
jgi:hypothetical protein